MRTIFNWNDKWGFYKGELDQDALLSGKNVIIPGETPGWESVDLPHTWNALDGDRKSVV